MGGWCQGLCQSIWNTVRCPPTPETFLLLPTCWCLFLWGSQGPVWRWGCVLATEACAGCPRQGQKQPTGGKRLQWQGFPLNWCQERCMGVMTPGSSWVKSFYSRHGHSNKSREGTDLWHIPAVGQPRAIRPAARAPEDTVPLAGTSTLREATSIPVPCLGLPLEQAVRGGAELWAATWAGGHKPPGNFLGLEGCV